MPYREKGKRKRRQLPAMSNRDICVRGRIWIDGPEDTLIGYGRIVLLESIIEHGSISKAAKSMEISYRHAWELIESMNSQAPHPLVSTSTGGAGGGGAIVTEYGHHVIGLFHDLYKQFQAFLDQKEDEVKKTFQKEF